MLHRWGAPWGNFLPWGSYQIIWVLLSVNYFQSRLDESKKKPVPNLSRVPCDALETLDINIITYFYFRIFEITWKPYCNLSEWYFYSIKVWVDATGCAKWSSFSNTLSFLIDSVWSLSTCLRINRRTPENASSFWIWVCILILRPETGMQAFSDSFPQEENPNS